MRRLPKLLIGPAPLPWRGLLLTMLLPQARWLVLPGLSGNVLWRGQWRLGFLPAGAGSHRRRSGRERGAAIALRCIGLRGWWRRRPRRCERALDPAQALVQRKLPARQRTEHDTEQRATAIEQHAAEGGHHQRKHERERREFHPAIRSAQTSHAAERIIIFPSR